MIQDVHDSSSYDNQWTHLQDFIRYNPGARHRRRLIARAISRIPVRPTSVIDVGCGPGFTVNHLSTVLPDASFTGIDFSEVAIEVASAKFPEHKWIVADASTAMSSEKFDLVVCTEVIEHVSDPKNLVDSLKDLTKPGGHLILTTQAGVVHDTEKAVGHVRHFTMKDLDELLENAGFCAVTRAQWGWPGYLFLKKIANLNAEQTMKKLGSGKYGIAAVVANSISYWFTMIGSLSTSSRGTQLIVLAQLPEA
jgi:ubiquinone/menaquinone biosynthesis C-methylase UbiE